MRIACIALVVACSSWARPLIVGVVASTSPEVAQRQADALAQFVESTLKAQTMSEVFPDQEALAKAVALNKVDLAVLGPLGYLRVDPKAKARLVFRTIREGKGVYRSVLFGPPKSPFGSLEALKKQKKPLKVAWVETSSATGYLVPKALMLKEGIDPAQLFEVQDFVGSHDAVCAAVFEGKYDLGATFNDPAPNTTKATGCVAKLGKRADSLKVVVMSAEIPNDVLVAAPAFPAAKSEAVFQAASAAGKTKEGKALLGTVLLAEGVAPVADEDFAPIREALDRFVP